MTWDVALIDPNRIYWDPALEKRKSFGWVPGKPYIWCLSSWEALCIIIIIIIIMASPVLGIIIIVIIIIIIKPCARR